jgi:hypothetical protein
MVVILSLTLAGGAHVGSWGFLGEGYSNQISFFLSKTSPSS